jgi:hypothetical protein
MFGVKLFGSLITLFGLVVEIFAGLILAIEAIGLDRVARWIGSISLAQEEIAGKRKEREDSSRDPGPKRIYRATLGALIGGFGAWFGSFAHTWDVRGWMYVAFALAGGVAGGLIGVGFLFSTVYGLRGIIWLLRFAEERAQRKAVGVIGFGLLFVGFILQFVGTLVVMFHDQ